MNYGDIIDSRDLARELADLEEYEAGGNLDEDETEALEELRALEAEIGEWYDGATLIRDDYFKQYAQEFAEDIGAVGSDAQWPVYCIDWKQAAEDLKQDYYPVELGGFTYWVR